MSFLKPQVSFPLNLVSPFSVMTHKSSKIFQLKHYILLTKRVNKCKILPNFSCYFLNHKAKVYSDFVSLFSVMKDNSSAFFQLKPHILWTKIAHRSEIFGLFSGWVKIHENPHVMFETSQFFLNLVSLVSVRRDSSSVLFQLKIYIVLSKGAHQSANFQTFNCSHENLPNSSCRLSRHVSVFLFTVSITVQCHER